MIFDRSLGGLKDEIQTARSSFAVCIIKTNQSICTSMTYLALAVAQHPRPMRRRGCSDVRDQSGASDLPSFLSESSCASRLPLA
jgi:hypothetical protein